MIDLTKTLPALALGVALALPGFAAADGHGHDHADMAGDAAEATMEATTDAAADAMDKATDAAEAATDAAADAVEATTEAMTETTTDSAMMSGDMTAAPDAEGAADAAPVITPPLDPIQAMMADRILGDVNAPVTLVEYASMTCPHCASFHNTVLPTLKEQYIDTGKVRMILRDFPLDQYALQAAALTRCAPEDRYHKLVEVVFAQQQKWARSRNPTAALANLFKLGGGMNDDQIEECVTNEKLLDELLGASQRYQERWEIRSTPTIILYNQEGQTERIDGSLAVSRFARTIDALLPAETDGAAE